MICCCSEKSKGAKVKTGNEKAEVVQNVGAPQDRKTYSDQDDFIQDTQDQSTWYTFCSYSCLPHQEITILGGALKIKCRDEPIKFQARLSNEDDFEAIVDQMEKRGWVSFVITSIISFIIISFSP
jgi:hypothetical protein